MEKIMEQSNQKRITIKEVLEAVKTHLEKVMGKSVSYSKMLEHELSTDKDRWGLLIRLFDFRRGHLNYKCEVDVYTGEVISVKEMSLV